MMRWVERDPAGRLRAVAWLALLAVGCGGCSPTYVLRAAYEETRILWSREPIDARLASGELSTTQRARLELVLEAREFAQQRLGMNVGGAYGSIADVGPGALLSVVSASERLRLQPYVWWFPIVGDVAYKGFFESVEAEAEAARLRTEGYDTYVRTSAAFSTLGWFDDPVLSSWLDLEPVPLVRLLLHELLHRTTYLSGRTTFNESFATFAGGVGVVRFFEARDGTDSPEAEQARAAWEAQVERSRRWGAALGRLRALYQRGEDGTLAAQEVLAQRRQIFAEFGPEEKVNNAVLLAHYAYLAHLDRFQCVLDANGGDLRTALAAVTERSEAAPGDPFAALGSCRPGQDEAS